MGDLGQLFDYYGRVARLYPAMLVVAPVLLLIIIAAPSFVQSVGQSAALGIVVLAVLYFLSALARSRGKKLEVRLIKSWDGWTSTFLLRHSDGSLDPYTKQRYHAALQVICPDLVFPDAASEISNPVAADGIYRSATKKLIELRRGPNWRLLLQENAAYGFRRNLLGLKPLGIGIALLMAIATFGYWWFEGGEPESLSAMLALFSTWPMPMLSAAFDLFVVIAWTTIVSQEWVRQGASDYAIALFRTLDTPQ